LSPSEQQERFDHWLREHAALFHHVANGFAESEDRHDLMQELLLVVWKAIPAFRGEAQPATFIYRVTHNAALTWNRTPKNYRHNIEQFESLISLDSAGAPTDTSVALLERVYAEVRLLPPVDRSLILLSLDGLSYRDLATTLDPADENDSGATSARRPGLGALHLSDLRGG